MQEGWAVDDCDGIICVVDGEDRTVCTMGENGEIKPWKPYKSAEANAKRIVDCVNGCAGINPAAVKDLLAALTDWTEWAINRDIPFELISKTRAAIAKAEQK